MAVVGIDLGSQSTKAVILNGDVIVGGASLSTGESAETEARMAVQEALRQAGLKREDLKAAVANQCIVNGLWGMVQRVGVPSKLLICGGVARNAGIVKAIEDRLGKPVLVPAQPQYVRALGAAVFARQMDREGVALC